jgi:integrase
MKMLKDHFGLRNLHNLKKKHVLYVVEEWRENDKGTGAVANNLAHLRWLTEKLGKEKLLPAKNSELDIPAKPRDVRQGMFVTLERQTEILGKLENPKLKAAMLLALHFGMRFEEASLFRPRYDVDTSLNRVWIKRGTKGGRERFVPIVTQGQREVLALAQSLVAETQGCLIDPTQRYVQWKNHAYKEFRKASLSRASGSTFHDLRRTYAEMEMIRLLSKGRSIEQAAEAVSKRLGHNRTEILSAYIAWAKE